LFKRHGLMGLRYPDALIQTLQRQSDGGPAKATSARPQPFWRTFGKNRGRSGRAERRPPARRAGDPLAPGRQLGGTASRQRLGTPQSEEIIMSWSLGALQNISQCRVSGAEVERRVPDAPAAGASIGAGRLDILKGPNVLRQAQNELAASS
jgi:hypothetical protein